MSSSNPEIGWLASKLPTSKRRLKAIAISAAIFSAPLWLLVFRMNEFSPIALIECVIVILFCWTFITTKTADWTSKLSDGAILLISLMMLICVPSTTLNTVKDVAIKVYEPLRDYFDIRNPTRLEVKVGDSIIHLIDKHEIQGQTTAAEPNSLAAIGEKNGFLTTVNGSQRGTAMTTSLNTSDKSQTSRPHEKQAKSEQEIEFDRRLQQTAFYFLAALVILALSIQMASEEFNFVNARTGIAVLLLVLPFAPLVLLQSIESFVLNSKYIVDANTYSRMPEITFEFAGVKFYWKNQRPYKPETQVVKEKPTDEVPSVEGPKPIDNPPSPESKPQTEVSQDDRVSQLARIEPSQLINLLRKRLYLNAKDSIPSIFPASGSLSATNVLKVNISKSEHITAELHELLGMAYANSGNWGGAANEFESAIAMLRSEGSHSARARLERRLGYIAMNENGDISRLQTARNMNDSIAEFYLLFRQNPPTTDTIPLIEQFYSKHPKFMPARDLLDAMYLTYPTEKPANWILRDVSKLPNWVGMTKKLATDKTQPEKLMYDPYKKKIPPFI